MLKKIVVAGFLALASVGPAAAQSAATAQPTAANPTVLTAVQACEAQMHRMAGLSKGLAANYNAERVHQDCVARAGTGTDFASK